MNWSFAIMVPTILIFFDSFPGQVKILAFCRSFHLSNLYSDLPSSVTPCYLKDVVSLHYLLWILIEMILHHIIPSLIGYIIIMLIFTVLPGPHARSNSRHQTKLTSIFLILSFHLKQQAWFRACVVSVVPITFLLIISFVWCRHCSMAYSKILSTKFVMITIIMLTCSRISLEFMMRNIILALDDLCYRRQHSCLLSNTCLIMSWLNFELLAIPAVVPLNLLWSSESNPCLKHHINASSKHDSGIPNISKDIESSLLNVCWSIIRTPLYG
jgi:hypothetical protein